MQIDNIRVATAALSGKIYIGRVSKGDPQCFTDSKREAEPEVMRAVVEHLQHGCDKPCAMQKTFSFDGEQYWRLRVEPVKHPTNAEGTDQ